MLDFRVYIGWCNKSLIYIDTGVYLDDLWLITYKSHFTLNSVECL